MKDYLNLEITDEIQAELSRSLGMRNNNPLNIRFSSASKWRGQNGSNKGFCRFVNLAYGYRAAGMLLLKYLNTYGCRSVEDIINRWAPSTENNTEAYISYVCGVLEPVFSNIVSDDDGDYVIEFDRCDDLLEVAQDCRLGLKQVFAWLLLAMTEVECGRLSSAMRKYLQKHIVCGLTMVQHDLPQVPQWTIKF